MSGNGGPPATDDYLGEVLDVVAAIPPGRAMTYGSVAEVVAQRLGKGGPRQVGQVLSHAGGGVPWWRVVNAAGRPPARHLTVALERLTAEGCPLRGEAVDLRAAAWWPSSS